MRAVPVSADGANHNGWLLQRTKSTSEQRAETTILIRWLRVQAWVLIRTSSHPVRVALRVRAVDACFPAAIPPAVAPRQPAREWRRASSTSGAEQANDRDELVTSKRCDKRRQTDRSERCPTPEGRTAEAVGSSADLLAPFNCHNSIRAIRMCCSCWGLTVEFCAVELFGRARVGRRGCGRCGRGLSCPCPLRCACCRWCSHGSSRHQRV